MLFVWACNGDAPVAEDDSTSSAVQADDEAAAADSSGDAVVIPDLPPPPADGCEAQGRVFGFTEDPIPIYPAPTPAGAVPRELGFVVGKTGMLATFRVDETYLALRALDDLTMGEPFVIPAPDDPITAHPVADTLVLSRCEFLSPPQWLVLDEYGDTHGSLLTADVMSTCDGYLAAAGDGDGNYLVTWFGRTDGEDCWMCQWLAAASSSELKGVTALRQAGDSLSGSSIGVGPRSALVVQAPNAYNGLELALTDLAGELLFPPMYYANEYTEPATDFPLRGTAVGATDDGDFLVLAAGYAGGLGKMRLDEVASVIEPFEPVLPTPDLAGLLPVYPYDFRVARRADGFVSTLAARWGDTFGTWMLVFDDDGFAVSQQFLVDVAAMRVDSHRERTWALLRTAEGLFVQPMGCL